MPSRLLLILLLGVTWLPARANLGDTVKQLMARYGMPTGYAEAGDKTPFGSILFKAGGFELVIFVLDNHEVGARLSKLDQSAFSDDELQKLMTAEANDQPWAPTASSDPSLTQWSRHDQATFAYDQTNRMVLLSSPAMVQALHDFKK